MRLRFLPVAFLMLASFAAHADTVGLTSITGGATYTGIDPTADVIGWQFTTALNITVTQLGIYDPVSYGYTLRSSHEVGLWNSTGTLLASATVSPLGTLVDSSLFAVITPVDLAAGTYTLGALFQSNGLNDRYVSSVTDKTTAAGITYVRGVYVNSSTLADPGSNGSTANGRFGPNFQFTTTAATPEPSSLMLLGTGLLGAVGVARRRLRV